MIHGLDTHKLNVIYKNIDELIEEYGIEEVELVLNKYIYKKKSKACDSCICKTCAIAYYNGGAPGCGDCWLCEGTPNQRGVTTCNEYYNPTPRKRKPSPYDEIKSEEESQE